jgi:hypothetical protein
MTGHELALRHAPLVVLDRNEALWPVAADEFVARCDLVWVGKKRRTAAATVSAAELGAKAGSPYLTEAADEQGFDPIACNEYTRPFDGRSGKLQHLSSKHGWALELRDEKDVAGARPEGRVPAVFEGPGTYYDIARDEQERFKEIRYWFCYAGSALQWLLAHRPQFRPREETVAVDESPLTEEDALRALELAHPELYDAAVREATSELAAPEEELPILQPELWGGVTRFFGELLPTYVDAIGNRFYLCHQGDWEGVTVHLSVDAPEDDPTGVSVSQHNDPPHPATWAQVDKSADGRRVKIYSASGSHASLLGPSLTKAGDRGDANGVEWRTWASCDPVRDQPWWGFGGAWGKVGRLSDLTGPLGPSRWKTGFGRP